MRNRKMDGGGGKGRYKFTHQDCRAGGLARSMQGDFKDLCHAGWFTTCHRYGLTAALAIIHKRSGKRKKTSPPKGIT